MGTRRFAIAINCIDGRTQQPVSQWVQEHLGVHFVDLITEPGAAGVLSRGSSPQAKAIRRKALLSISAHRSGAVAIAGHHGCAGNPVSAEEHRIHIRRAVEVVASWRLPVPIVGLWVNRRWGVEVVCRMDGPGKRSESNSRFLDQNQ